MDMPKLINGAYIKAARKRKGLTQQQLADRLGIAFQTVGAWERGTNGVPLDMNNRIATALDVSIDQLTLPTVEPNSPATTQERPIVYSEEELRRFVRTEVRDLLKEEFDKQVEIMKKCVADMARIGEKMRDSQETRADSFLDKE